MVIVRPDRTIAFRQIAEDKADRLTAPQLAATLDRTFATTGPGARHITPLDYAQLRADLGGGIDSGPTGFAALSALTPINRHALIGLSADTRGDLDGEFDLRAPVFGDASAVELGFRAGDGRHANGAARAAWWFALSPSLGAQLGVQYDVRADTRALTVTLGVSRILHW